MPFVTYTARRGLAPSHAAGTSYTLDLSLTDLQRPSSEDLKVSGQSLAGNVETLFFGEIRKWGVTLAPIPAREATLLYEFLRSTADGQTFTFDPYGTPGSNVQAMSVIRADSGYTESPFQRVGAGGLNDWITLAFQVREV